jgi:hypothetical protein
LLFAKPIKALRIRFKIPAAAKRPNFNTLINRNIAQGTGCIRRFSFDTRSRALEFVKSIDHVIRNHSFEPSQNHTCAEYSPVRQTNLHLRVFRELLALAPPGSEFANPVVAKKAIIVQRFHSAFTVA